MRSPVRAAWSLAGTSAPAHHASGSSQTFRASAPGLTRCAGCALHHLSSPSPSPSHQPPPQPPAPAPAPATSRSLSRSPIPTPGLGLLQVRAALLCARGDQQARRQQALHETVRRHAVLRAQPSGGLLPSLGSSQPASPPARPPASQPGGSDGLPPCLSRYIVAQCREDDPAPCPRVATPAAPLHHPEIAQYFAGFDPQRGYLPTSELAALYPDG